MINFFKKSTEKESAKHTQADPTVSQDAQSIKNTTKETKPVHGENGVCCGGCGGQ